MPGFFISVPVGQLFFIGPTDGDRVACRKGFLQGFIQIIIDTFHIVLVVPCGFFLVGHAFSPFVYIHHEATILILLIGRPIHDRNHLPV